MKVLITGADGMIGHAVWRYFEQVSNHETFASVRSDRHSAAFGDGKRLIQTGDLAGADGVARLFDAARPDMVINCAGLTKHAEDGHNPLKVIHANCILPHRLTIAAREGGARIIHVSTDCVYQGTKGTYSETEAPDADDLYGRSKVLGEITDQPHVLTIRTSTVGFELASQRGLLEWFLAQQGTCRGFSRAIFSGVTSLALGRILDQHVLSAPELTGLLHIAGPRIDKYALLGLFREHFGLSIAIDRDDAFAIDRSLDASRFTELTGYVAPSWDSMLSELVEMGR